MHTECCVGRLNILQKPVLQTGIYPPCDKNTKTATEVVGTGKVEIECQRAVSCCCFTGTIGSSKGIFEPRERQIKAVMSKRSFIIFTLR